jgi:hypothetical protein
MSARFGFMPSPPPVFDPPTADQSEAANDVVSEVFVVTWRRIEGYLYRVSTS